MKQLISRRLRRTLLAIAAACAAIQAPAMHIAGGHVYDESGQRLHLQGVNWFGFETELHAPHGLWARNLGDMLDQMHALGFNAVRVPFCPATLQGVPISGIDYGLNPQLQGQNSLQVLDSVIAQLEQRGMYYLLDHHRPDCEAISELWYTGSYTESQWIADLQFVAQRYATRAHFLGMDLKNEPHGAATWGSGNSATDWNGAAERAGHAVLAKAPNALVFVEGISRNDYCTDNAAGTWWGGNLGPQSCKPLNLPADHLVLSPHVYGPDVFEQAYFSAPDFPSNLAPIWNANFGKFAAQGYAVIVGETGGQYGRGDPKDKIFQDTLFAWLGQHGMTDLFYWCWNPNSGDTGGILDDDWKTVRDDKMALLRGYWGGGAEPAIVLGKSALTVREGKSAKTEVSLSAAPASTITVRIARADGGDRDLTASPRKLVFTPANFAVPQRLAIKAAQDADTADGTATFTLTAPGYTDASLAATEQDDDHPAGACSIAFDTSNSWNDGEVQQVTLTNTGTTPISNWSISWTESADFTLGSTWSATFAQSGRGLVATPVDFNAVVPPGTNTTFGLTLAFGGSKPMPTGARLAGADCTVTVK